MINWAPTFHDHNRRHTSNNMRHLSQIRYNGVRTTLSVLPLERPMHPEVQKIIAAQRKKDRDLKELYTALTRVKDLKNPDLKLAKLIQDEITALETK